MHIDAHVEAWVRLSCTGLGGRAIASLLRAFGSPEAAAAATPAQIEARLPAVMAATLRGGNPADRTEAALRWLEQPDHRMLAWDEPGYPPALLQIPDSPPVLYAMGDPALLMHPALAIVGSRNATPRGCLDAQEFAAALVASGLAIVSGLAIGIDAAAHRGALRAGGATIAVIGTGPDRVYPARNRDLAREIAAKGLIVSEFAPGTPALKSNFPRRNRIISGISRGVLVVEATLSSGSLITANAAADQGREVFALPGSIHSPFSRGCHRLIKNGAKLVETAIDILEELGLAPASNVSAHMRRKGARDEHAEPPAHASDDARMVWKALGTELTEIDALGLRTSLPAERITAALAMLEVDGRVARAPGGCWQRL